MNAPHDIEHEIQALVDGHLTEDEEQVLVDRIAGDPELVDLLVSYTGLDISISKALRFSPEEFRANQHTRRPKQPRSMGLVLLASAAMMAAMLTVLWLVIPPTKSPHVVLRGSGGTGYEILTSSEGRESGSDAGLFVGDGIAIKQGVMELTFTTGVKAILQGPAELWLEKEHFVRLVRGKARFRVPPSMSGFRVATEDVRAIDLGTEFAIEVIEDGPDEIHIIDGRVDVSPVGNPERGQIVGAMDARSMVHHGLPKTIPYEGSTFLSDLPAGLPYLHLPMEVGTNGALVVRGNINGEAGVRGHFITGKSNSKPTGPVKGRYGSALGFNGNGDHIVTDWMGIGQDDPRTVAFWAKVENGTAGYDLACVAWGQRPPGRETLNRKWNLQLALDRKTRSRCILNTTFGGLWMEGQTSLDDGKWHHVAAVYAGHNLPDGMPDLRLYVDGRAESGEWVLNRPADRTEDGIRIHTETGKEIGAQPMTIARSLHPSMSKKGCFQGEIDELYVFAGALRPDDIRSLMLRNEIEHGAAAREEVTSK